MNNIIIMEDIPEYQIVLEMFKWVEFKDGTIIVNPRYMDEWRAEYERSSIERVLSTCS